MPRNGYYKITRKGDRLLRLHEEEQEDAWETFNRSAINQLIDRIQEAHARGVPEGEPIDTSISPDSGPGEDLSWFAEVSGRLGLLQHIKEDEFFLDEHVNSEDRHIVEELLDKGYIRFIAFKVS